MSDQNPPVALEEYTKTSLKGVEIMQVDGKVVFAANVKEMSVTPTPRDKVSFNIDFSYSMFNTVDVDSSRFPCNHL